MKRDERRRVGDNHGMRVLGCIALVFLATVTHAAPKKKPAAKAAAGAKQAVVIDAPPAMARVLQTTLAPRFAVTINRNALSDAPLAKEVRSVTTPVKAIAVVLARSAGDTWSLTVLNGADGTPLDNQQFRAPARKPLKALPKNVAGAIVLACATGQAPATEAAPAPAEPSTAKVEPKATEPKGEPKKSEPAVAKAEPAKSTTGTSSSTASSSSSTAGETTLVGSTEAPGPRSALPALRVGLGFRGFNRSLTWSGDPDQALARYALGFAPAVAFDVNWYPGAHVTTGVLANLGVAFQGDIGVGISSRQDASRFGTRAQRYRISGAFRLPLGSVVSLEGLAGFSTQSFSIDAVAANDGSPRPNIPSVTFNGPRAALGGRFGSFGPVSIDAQVGFTFLAFLGELGSAAYFGRAGGFGLDAGAGVALELVSNINLRAGFDFTRYFLTLRPEEGARFTAPSAADQYLGVNVALQWVM
jgi:hypothetical protein